VLGLAAAAHAASAAQAQVLDQALIAAQPINGHVPSELSGLAWDGDEQLLYAVSDRGLLFHFRLELDGARLRSITPLRALPLMAAQGSTGTRMNAEGLALVHADNGRRGDTQLVVALENGPRLVRYTPQGQPLGEVPLPAPLRDPAAYRNANSRLEAVSPHPLHGFVTAPQRPLKAQPRDVHRLYASDGTQWTLPAAEQGALKAIETLPDGALLVLERQGKGKAVTPLLHRIDLAACATRTGCAGGDVVRLPGLDAGDNFEGLARIAPNLFVMVSDDGGNPSRPTRLVLFRFNGP
jgi:hypothetical protein